jgi:hypothetical protein
MEQKNEENKRLNIQLIETIVNRMSSNSFLIKGWSITMLSALIAVYLTNMNKPFSKYILYSCILFCIVFWISDAYYLRQERMFRKLYTEVIEMDEEEITFSMDTSKFKECFFKCMVRPIFLITYVPILIFLILMVNHLLFFH